MRSIEKRFERIRKEKPGLTTYTAFAETIEGQNYGKQYVLRAFRKLVDKDDYDRGDRPDIIIHLLKLNKGIVGENSELK